MDLTAGLRDELKSKFCFLEKYYASGKWREDYKTDEAGLLPPDLKRGVLSQDGVYDFLEQLERTRKRDE